MSFLQKVMFDERMTPLEYEFFNAIWTVSGVTPDYFETVLMVKKKFFFVFLNE